MPSLRDVGEFEALRRLIGARGPGSGVVVGPGDDAAVLAPGAGRQIVVTTDAMVEGRHFLPDWLEPAARGARLSTANLSDLAAMAAEPRWALLSAGLRPEHDLDALLAFQGGALEPLAREGAAIVGGNLTAVEGPEWFDMTLIGEVSAGAAWTRAGARPGDLIAVSGHPGRAGAGLRLARHLGERSREPKWQPLLDAWRFPVARIGLARELAATGAIHAAIDLSDGLAGDLEHLVEASAVAVEAGLAALPRDPLLERAGAALGVGLDELRLGASDDYELVMAVDPSGREAVAGIAARRSIPLSFVGRVVAGAGTSWGAVSGRPISGYDHFSR